MSFDPLSYLRSRPPGRFLLGIAGCPGAGKSTFASQLAAQLGPSAVVLPMDGFHFTNVQLDHLGLRQQKGAPDTYDVPAFIDMLTRARNTSETVYSPAYSRVTHEPEADAIAIEPGHRFVLVEGNYLLVETIPWDAVAGLLDETWFLDVTPETAATRLRQRHLAVGRSEVDAEAKIQTVDIPNGKIVLASRSRADRFLVV